MRANEFDEITLRLLRVFETVYRTRNVSEAAHLLDVSQPSVSLSLNRLRRHFKDPLFVRVGSTMQPTPRAKTLMDGVEAMLIIANDHFVTQAPFLPAESNREFSLHMTDLGEAILVAKIINHLAAVAPRVRLKIGVIGESTQAMLADGAVDLILGYISPQNDDLYQRKLFDERFVCVARAGHPRIRSGLTLEQFNAEAHIVVSIGGTGHAQIWRGLEGARLHKSTVLEVSGYLAVGATVRETDLIATVPARLAEQLARDGKLRVFDLPFESPVFQVRQYWHGRAHNDAGCRWLRNMLAELFPI